MKPFYFEAKSEQEVDIHIYGAIGWDESMWGDGTNNTAFALVQLIKRLDKTYGRINVHINSPGGIIDQGLAIYNTLKNTKAEIHTFNSGMTASMASIIMLAGKTHMPKTSIYHLHRASTVAIGNVNDFEAEIENLKVFEATLIQAISDKTGMSVDEIQEKWFDGKEHYLTAEQASEFGFVDVLEETQAKTPASLENLQNMKFNQVLNLYKQSVETKTEVSFLDKVKSLFMNKSINNESRLDMSNLTFKAKLTVLLAIVGLQEFALNAANKIEISLDEAFKINDEIENRNNEIENLKQANAKLEENNAALNSRIDELQAKLDGKPVDVVNPKSKDNVIVDERPTDQLDESVAKSLHEYNRKLGIYK